VAFPDPADVGVSKDGSAYLNLPKLIELKLASGMSNIDRLKDLADVLELIKVLSLPAELAKELNPYVCAEYTRLWNSIRTHESRFVLFKPAESAKDENDLLEAMRADGVTIENLGNEIRLITTDPVVARKYNMMDEKETMEE